MSARVILIVLILFVSAGNKAVSPIFNRNYVIKTSCKSTTNWLISVPDNAKDYSNGRLDVYRGKKMEYSFRVKNISGFMYVVIGDITTVAAIYTDIGFPKIPNTYMIDNENELYQQPIRIYRNGILSDSVMLPKLLAYTISSSLDYNKNLKKLSTQMNVDDSCLYKTSDAFAYKINLFTKRVSLISQDDNFKRMKIKVFDTVNYKKRNQE